MNKESFIARKAGLPYVMPVVELIPVAAESVLCESPLPGGNEGIGFEPWN